MNEGRLRALAIWLADAVALTGVWCLVTFAYWASGLGAYRLPDYLGLWPVIFLYTGINWCFRLYCGHGIYPRMPLPPVEEFRRLILSAVATHLLVMAVLGFLHRGTEVSRFVLIASGLLTAVLAQPCRDFIRWMLFRLKIGQIPAVIVGDGAAGGILMARLADNPYFGFAIKAHFHREQKDELLAYARSNDIKHLFCAYRDDRFFRAQLPDLAGWFTFIEYLPTPRAFPVADARAIQVGGLGGLEMVNQRRMKLLALEKSFLDRFLSLVIFILSCPCFIIFPILIKLTSKGPVFYKAKRLGKKGRTILVWKFRSMYADADRRLDAMLEQDPALKAEFEKDFKLKHDPRVTPLGAFMRKTSIDELPQLFNVFMRDMALIGPRPIVGQEVEKYGKAYELLSSVKPGITGLWQASGRSDCDYDERVALDVHYILNWSPWLDLWIVFRTIAAVLKMKGSY